MTELIQNPPSRGRNTHAVENGKTAVGFLAARAVKAESAEAATTKAKALVAELWASPEHAEQNKGSSPTLRTEEVEKLVGLTRSVVTSTTPFWR